MTQLMKRILLVLGAAVLSGCTTVGLALLNGFTPSDQIHQCPSVAYGPHEQQVLDVFRPSLQQEPAPVVMFFHGGYWSNGSRTDYQYVGRTLAAQGFVAVVVGYRLYPEVVFPEFMDDATAAVRWTKQNIQQYGGDSNSIFLSGHSAGAHIASLLALDSRYLGKAAADDIAGVIALAGPTAFLPPTTHSASAIEWVFPQPELYEAGDPLNFVRADAAPILLLHGVDDVELLPANSQRLANKLQAAGGAVTLRLLPGVSHKKIIIGFAGPFREHSGAVQAMTDFVRQVYAKRMRK